jgi:hypothetical protein
VDELLRFVNLATGEELPLYGEAVEIAERQRARADEAEQRANAANQPVAELLAEVSRLRGE